LDVRLSSATYRRICIAACWSLAGIIVTGAGVRLTGSGLGCSDWPTCENNKLIAPLEFHAMIEFINRTITGVVSIAVMLAVLGSLLVRPRRRDLVVWSGALVVGVIAQILIGALVVTTKLTYSVVALHFLVSMVLVWAAIVLVDRAGRPTPPPRGVPLPNWARLMLAAAIAVLCTGAVVTSTGPHAGDADVERLPLDLGWTARLHSGAVWILVATIVWVTWRFRHTASPTMRRRTTDLLAASVLQGGLGYLQYFSGVPAIMVGAHVAGATLVWILVVRLALCARAEAAEATEVPDESADALPTDVGS